MVRECPQCKQRFTETVLVCPSDGTRLESPPPGTEDVFIGSLVGGQYRIVDLVGEGGIGVVYRARQESVGRDVAIKVLRRRFQRQDSIVRRFENEARVISQLRHPNTLRIYDCQRAETGELYIVTELLHGRSLHDLLCEGPLPIDRVIRIVDQICGSLSEAHEAGIVHRDLKPDNIYLDRVGHEDHAKVLDFGIAKLLQGESMQTQANTLVGTPAYMSPEQARGEPADRRSDIYSLGVVLYEMIAGEPPFRAESPVAFLLKHIQDEAPRFAGRSDLAIEVPTELEELVRSMLEKSPDARPQTIDEIRERLKRIGADFERRVQTTRFGAAATPTEQIRTRGNGSIGRAEPPAGRVAPVTPGETNKTEKMPSLPGRRSDTSAELSLPLGDRAPLAPWAAALAVLALGIALTIWVVREKSEPEVITTPVLEEPSLSATGSTPAHVRVTSEPDRASVIAADGTVLGKTELDVSIEAPASYQVIAPDGGRTEIHLDPAVHGGKTFHVVIPPLATKIVSGNQDPATRDSRRPEPHRRAARKGRGGNDPETDPLPSAGTLEDEPVPVSIP